MNSAARAVFLDRDGVINRPPSEGLYVTSPDDIVLLPGGAEAIYRLNCAGFLVFVVTNQRCIARGLVAAETVHQIHVRMLQLIRESGGRISQVYVCPHDHSDGCECRKPKPGMLQQAAGEHSLQLASCWMVGDRPSDITAGQAVGCRTVLVARSREVTSDFRVSSLAEAVDYILADGRFGNASV